MKKMGAVSLVVFLLSGFSGSVLAAQRGTPEYEKMKEYKKAQREKKNEPATPTEKNFWQKEAERSGLAGTAAMFGGAVACVIPGDQSQK